MANYSSNGGKKDRPNSSDDEEDKKKSPYVFNALRTLDLSEDSTDEEEPHFSTTIKGLKAKEEPKKDEENEEGAVGGEPVAGCSSSTSSTKKKTKTKEKDAEEDSSDDSDCLILNASEVDEMQEKNPKKRLNVSSVYTDSDSSKDSPEFQRKFKDASESSEDATKTVKKTSMLNTKKKTETEPKHDKKKKKD